MNVNDAINALFENGVTAATLMVTPQGEKTVTVEQELRTVNGVSKMRHQVAGNDWPDCLTKLRESVVHCADLRASIIKMN